MDFCRMEAIVDEDRRRRLRSLEEKITDPRSVTNVDCLLVRLCSIGPCPCTYIYFNVVTASWAQHLILCT